jgi:hypothetical protein
MIFTKSFDEIEPADLLQLVDDGVRESHELDYKQDLPAKPDGDKKEFLRDITALANSAGGWIIYGVQEKVDAIGNKTGEPEKCSGVLLGTSADAEIRRLDSLIAHGVEPALTGVRIRDLSDPAFSSGPVFMVQVPDSWAKPHMITLKSDSRFYARNNAGKFPMDVTQIRASFLASESLVDRIRAFREERVHLVRQQRGPVPTVGPGRLVLHVIPLRSFELAAPDVTVKANQERPNPISYVGDMVMPNFDGYLSYRRHPDTYTTESYLQVFRDGCLEAVDCPTVNSAGEDPFRIPGLFLAEKLEEALLDYIRFYDRLALEPPLVVMLSLVDVEKHRLLVGGGTMGQPIRREEMLLPEILLRDPASELPAALNQMLDVVWQSGGFLNSSMRRDR